MPTRNFDVVRWYGTAAAVQFRFNNGPLLGPQTDHVLGWAHLIRIFVHLSVTTLKEKDILQR
jgi:hypothetical protein